MTCNRLEEVFPTAAGAFFSLAKWRLCLYAMYQACIRLDCALTRPLSSEPCAALNSDLELPVTTDPEGQGSAWVVCLSHSDTGRTLACSSRAVLWPVNTCTLGLYRGQ